MGEVTPLPYEIVLVDDHPLVRQAIKAIIAEKSELVVLLVPKLLLGNHLACQAPAWH